MQKTTHAIVGGMFALLPAIVLPDGAKILVVVWGAFWGTLSDLIEWRVTGHHWRSYLTHSPASLAWPGALWVILGITTGDIFLGPGAMLAWASHVLLDSLNPTGVPVKIRTYRRIARIPYDSLSVNALFVVICGVPLCLLFI